MHHIGIQLTVTKKASESMYTQDQIEAGKQFLEDYANEVLIPSPKGGRHMFNCPFCESGTGKNGTGAFSIKNDHWHCFACHENGDIYNLVEKMEGIEKFNNKVDFVMKKFGIEEMSAEELQSAAKERQKEYTDPLPASEMEYLEERIKGLKATTYLSQREITRKTAEAFGIGFDPNWIHPTQRNNPNAKAKGTPRILIPNDSGGYTARLARAPENDFERRLAKQKAGPSGLFNSKALAVKDCPVIVVEGEIDALSVIQEGGNAVGLGGIGNSDLFVKEAQKAGTGAVIVALDNDEPGKEASKKLIEGLKKAKIQAKAVNLSGIFKDPNEYLINDPENFKQAVKPFTKKGDSENYLEATSAGAFLEEFTDWIQKAKRTAIPTGFKELDEVLDGGLYDGLYFMGAISSLGKTTFVLQIADQIAAQGKDVLIFSLEMSKTELMAKSISRETAIEGVKIDHLEAAKDVRGITNGDRWKDYSEMEKNLIQTAFANYKAYADHIFISEGNCDIGVREVRETIERHIRATGNTPVAIIDYIQILAPVNERGTDKQNTDAAVSELKRISRDFKTPVIGISSLNRSSYSEKISMSAFKETGAIEYSADVLLGLQLYGAGTTNSKQGFDVDQAKSENPRKIELKVLKNRNGVTGKTLCYSYYPQFNLFMERKDPFSPF